MSRKPTISVCMIVKNEEEMLPRLLTSIRGLADEVIVVDTGSTDRTVDIAESFAARIHYFPWCNDFSAARNESLRHATKEYILWLDADDEVGPQEHIKILRAIKSHRNAGLFLKLKNIQERDVSESLQLRIFPNHRGITFEGRVHEQALYSLMRAGIPTFPCDAVVVHHGYKDAGFVLEILRRNREILELEIQDKPDSIHTLFFLAKTLKGLGEIEKSLACLDRIVDLYRKNPDPNALDIIKLAWTERATLLYMVGREDEALSNLKEGDALFPGYPPLVFALGELYYRRKEYGYALKTLLLLKDETFENEINPLNIQETRKCLRTYLGVSALFEGECDLAAEFFKTSAAEDPLDGSNYQYWSLARERIGDLDGAIEACDKGLAKLEDKYQLNRRRFLLLVEKGDFAGALEEHGRFEEYRNDIEVMSGMFYIGCKTLDADRISNYYDRLQEGLSLEPMAFPENFEATRTRLETLSDVRAQTLFNSGISYLMEQTA